MANADTTGTKQQENYRIWVPAVGAGLRQAGLDKQFSLCQARAVVPSTANPPDACCDDLFKTDKKAITAQLAVPGHDCASLAARGSELL